MTVVSILAIRRTMSSTTGEAIDALAVVVVAVACDEHLRLDLAKRSTTPLTPKSGEHDDQMAPILVAASMPMIASGQFGRIRSDAIARHDCRHGAARPRTPQPRDAARPSSVHGACHPRRRIRARRDHPCGATGAPQSSAGCPRYQPASMMLSGRASTSLPRVLNCTSARSQTASQNAGKSLMDHWYSSS